MYVFQFLVQEPRTRGPALFSLIARIPLGAMGLLLPLLSLSLDMSATVAAGSLGLCRLGQAITGPMWGRLVDRTSLRVVMAGAGAALTGSVLLLGVAARQPWAMLVLSSVIGVLILPLNAMMRALWQRTLDSADSRASANVFESTMTEVVLLASRLAVALCALVLPLRTTVMLQALLIAVGTSGVVMSGLLRTDEPTPPQPNTCRSVAGRVAAVRPLAAFFFLSASLGAFAFTLLLAAGGQGSSGAALAIAAWGAGSVVGLAVLRLDRLASAKRIHGAALLTVLMGFAQIVSSLPDLPIWQIVVVGFVAGLPIAAVVNEIYAELEETIDPARRSEYFAWATTVLFVGDAVGAMAVGAAVDLSNSLVFAASTATLFALVSATVSVTHDRARD